jgi:hypothetical protein
MEPARLQRLVWLTAQARFCAARRVENSRKLWSAILIAVAYCQLLLSILILAIPVKPIPQVILSACLLSIGALTVFIADSEALTKGTLYSYIYHACGMQLQDLEHRIDIHCISKLSDIAIEAKLSEFTVEYYKILRESNLNHKPCDYERAIKEANKFTPPSQ